MMLLHANAVLQGAAAPPLLVILTGALGVYFRHNIDLVAWAFVTLVAYAGLTAARPQDAVRPYRGGDQALAQALSRRPFHHRALLGRLRAPRLQRLAPAPSFVIFKGLMLLIALAMTAMSTFTIRGAIQFAFLPPVAALAAERDAVAKPL